MDLSGVGVWSNQLRYGDPAEASDAAAELDDLGYTALWIPDVGGPVLDSVDHLLASTKQVVIATGILNLWMHEPSDVAAGYASLTKKYGERFLLGIGCSTLRSSTRRNPAATASPWPRRARSSTPSMRLTIRCPSRTGCSRRSARRCWSCPQPVPGAPIRTSAHPTTPARPESCWATVLCYCPS